MKLSVLHISDLHRDPANPISNKTLLDSLERDRDHYATDGALRIKSPDLIIVSGDIVQGVRYGTPNAADRLLEQYGEALQFLNDLADRFVGGDKRRVVITPGNHDVSDYHFRQSLEPIQITDDNKGQWATPLFSKGSLLRWDWAEFALYRIADVDLYSSRSAPFAEFYNNFYDGTRTYSKDPALQFDIFDFPDWGMTVTGFSSCYNNDLLNREGAIHPDCIAGASNQLRDVQYQGRLLVAVWHHHIEGLPKEMDYMDPDIVQNLIDVGFSLGLHGHHHKPQYLDTRFRHGRERRITLISAGTLCGGPALGFNRSYNIIELDTEERCGRINVREMRNDNLAMSIWGARLLASESVSSDKFTFDPPQRHFVDLDKNTDLLAKASRLYDQGNFDEAAWTLSTLAASEALARRLLLNCLLQLEDDARIISSFDPPTSVAEAIAVMDSLWNQDRRDQLIQVLDTPLVDKSTDAALIEIREKYSARLAR